jgi:hypothetical protein
VIELAIDQSWPSVACRHDAVQVEYVTGATAANLVPKPLVQAMALLVGHWYEHREASITGQAQTPIEFAVSALCAPYQVFWREPEW